MGIVVPDSNRAPFLLACQRYTYSGAATSLPLVVDLGYAIADHSTDTRASAEPGFA